MIEFRPETSVSHEEMLVDGDDETFRHVLFLARLFAERLAIFREVIAKEIGLSGNQYVILLAPLPMRREMEAPPFGMWRAIR